MHEQCRNAIQHGDRQLDGRLGLRDRLGHGGRNDGSRGYKRGLGGKDGCWQRVRLCFDQRDAAGR